MCGKSLQTMTQLKGTRKSAIPSGIGLTSQKGIRSRKTGAPSHTQLKLDYDHDSWFQLYDERMRVLKWLFEFEVLKERFYESKGGGHHIRVWISMACVPLEVSLLQAILGSDPVREAFNLRRIRAGQKNWNVLFTPKKEILVGDYDEEDR